MTKSYITTRGLSPTQDLVLRSLIELLPGRTREDWGYSDDENADVMIIDVESTVGGKIWERYSTQDRKHCVVAVVNEASTLGVQYSITKPIRFRGLLDVLDNISTSRRWLSEAGHNNGWQLKDEQVVVAPSHYKLLEILISKKLGHAMRVSVGDVDLFVVDSAQNRCYLLADIERVYEACTSYEVEIRTQPETQQQIELPLRSTQLFSLESFRWNVGLNAFGGKLLPEIANWRGYQLNHWPNFGGLNHLPGVHPQLAAYLSAGPGTVDSISETLGLNKSEVIDFLNACYLCGWLANMVQTAKDNDENKLSAGMGRVVVNIRRRLGV